MLDIKLKINSFINQGAVISSLEVFKGETVMTITGQNIIIDSQPAPGRCLTCRSEIYLAVGGFGHGYGRRQ